MMANQEDYNTWCKNLAERLSRYLDLDMYVAKSNVGNAWGDKDLKRLYWVELVRKHRSTDYPYVVDIGDQTDSQDTVFSAFIDSLLKNRTIWVMKDFGDVHTPSELDMKLTLMGY